MLRPHESLVSYSSQRPDLENPEESNASADRHAGAMTIRNRSVSIRDHLKGLSLREEELLTTNPIQQQLLERELLETKRRADEQSIVLDMRTQQLLNYTHEHVSHTREESERRMDEAMQERIQASHSSLNDELQLQTRRLQYDIQGHLQAEHEEQIANIERRLTRQSSHLQDELQASENRIRAELYDCFTTKMREVESKFEESWVRTQEFVTTALNDHDDTVDANQHVIMDKYVKQRLLNHEDKISKLISVQLRDERRHLKATSRQYTTTAMDALEARINGELEGIRQQQVDTHAEIQAELAQKLQNVRVRELVTSKESAQLILQEVENGVGVWIKREVDQAIAKHEQDIRSMLQELQKEQCIDTAPHTVKVTSAIKQTHGRRLPSSRKAMETTALDIAKIKKSSKARRT